jgi:uncharacterized BrkB/YihY/UPF0761 family membrane protein
MNLTSVTYGGVLGSVGLSAVLSAVMLPSVRSMLRKFYAADDVEEFWTRYFALMFFLGPLVVTLVFGIPNSNSLANFSSIDLVTRVATATLFGLLLTLLGTALRVGSLRQNVLVTPPTRKTDDEFFR